MEEDEPIPEVAVQQAMMDDQADMDDSMYEAHQEFGSYPGASKRDSIFTFFKHIVGIRNSSKVANLDRRELGMLDLSVRNCQWLAHVGKALSNKSYQDLFSEKGEITLATSMSKKGWLVENVISQKKISSRTVQPIQSVPQKKSFLGMGGGKPSEPQAQ